MSAVRKWTVGVMGAVVMLWSGVLGHGPRAEDYRIAPPDVLEISIWGEPELRRENLIVRPDGKVSFPLVGDLEVAGKTTAEVKGLLEQAIQQFIPQASASVIITQMGSMQFYVLGKVARPGMFNIATELNVLQALSMAGGLTPFAREGDIVVVRVQGGVTVRLPFDYGRVRSGRNLEQNILLQRGDVVLVP
jgi:polysaccharide export outer membrane protein